MNSERRFGAFVDGDLLVYFRVVFGGIMLYWVVNHCLRGWVDAYYLEPRYHFHYFGFAWVRPLPEPWMRWHFYALGVSAAFILLGFCYRLAALWFAVGFSFVFLIDKCLYQNHYYLVTLIAWIMVVMPANREASLDARIDPEIIRRVAPQWTVWLLRFQIGVPYVFGGIAKLNSDWIAGAPMRLMLRERVSLPVIGSFLTEEWCVQFFVWGGLLFDLAVVPLLLWSRSRPFAFGAAVCFHLVNSQLFTIGIFPWFMMLATVVFFPPGSIRKWWSRKGNEARDLPFHLVASGGWRTYVLMYGLWVYVVVQLVVPLRHVLQPGDPSWTEEGHYFSWHMLLRGKQAALRYQVTDPRTGRSGTVDLRDYVTAFQLDRCSRDPRMIHELAKFIAADLRQLGFPDVEVRALSLVSLNGRRPQLLVAPDVDLAAVKVGWRQPPWIVPLTEPLRTEPWSHPLLEWERRLATSQAAE